MSYSENSISISEGFNTLPPVNPAVKQNIKISRDNNIEEYAYWVYVS